VALAKHMQVVVDSGDGHEIDITPKLKETRTMAQPGTARLPLVRTRVEHLLRLTDTAREMCSHWDAEFAAQFENALAALGNIADKLEALPEGFIAPRKPPTRKFERLQPGDTVRLTEKGESRYMGKLKGKPLTVVSITDGWAEVQLEGDAQKPTVELKHLVAA